MAQCWNRDLLSDIKLAVESPVSEKVTVLFHLGLADERVWEVSWDELDRSFDPDHLTSLWIPALCPPVAAELLALDELVHTLRLRCPWDREQTHGSLARHLLEESYEVLEAIDELAALDAASTHQPRSTRTRRPDDTSGRWPIWRRSSAICSSRSTSTPSSEPKQGRFNLADVARGVHDKLVSRHPHVFGDADAADPRRRGHQLGGAQDGRKEPLEVTEGIPSALPALALAAKLQRKAGPSGWSSPVCRRRSRIG